MNAALTKSKRPGGFTLIEILIAISIMVILLGAIHAAFLGALHLREKTTNSIENALPIEQALQIMQHDLANLVASTNTNAVFFRPLQSVNQTNAPLPGQIGPDFYTSNGELDGMSPWGNVEKIDYLLSASTNGYTGPGMSLIRAITHNLLPVNQLPTPEERQVLLDGVQSLTFLYYDGTQWDNAWDAMQQTNLPTAIKVQILLAARNGAPAPTQPLELVVPVDVLLTTNAISPVQ